MFVKIMNYPNEWPERNREHTEVYECKHVDCGYSYHKNESASPTCADLCSPDEKYELLNIHIDNGGSHIQVPTGRIINETTKETRNNPLTFSVYVMSDEGKTIDRLL